MYNCNFTCRNASPLVNNNELLGYYALLKFENDDNKEAKLWSVGTEITENSKIPIFIGLENQLTDLSFLEEFKGLPNIHTLMAINSKDTLVYKYKTEVIKVFNQNVEIVIELLVNTISENF